MPVTEDKSKLHHNHRQRMFARYDATGFAGFSEHEMLEMILFYTIKGKDTNALAHRILNSYGPLKRVFTTPAADLMKIDGVGKETARYLNLLGEAFRMSQKGRILKLTEDNILEFLDTLYEDKDREEFYIICLDPKCNILGYKKLSEGSFESTEVDPGKAVKFAMNYDTARVLFVHNHPSGVLEASDSDIYATRTLEGSMTMLGIKFEDHLIYAGGKCLSIMRNYRVKKDRSIWRPREVTDVEAGI